MSREYELTVTAADVAPELREAFFDVVAQAAHEWAAANGAQCVVVGDRPDRRQLKDIVWTAIADAARKDPEAWRPIEAVGVFRFMAMLDLVADAFEVASAREVTS